MKKINCFFLSLFLLFSFQSFSQKKKEMSYNDIIRKYEKIDNKSIEIKRLLAESYYHTGEYFKAEDMYSEIVFSNERTAEDVYIYASVLAENEAYDDYERWMETYARMAPQDSRSKLFLENKEFVDQLLEETDQFRVKNININSEHQDFGAVYYKKQVVFASSRRKMGFIKRIWSNNQLPYLDLFIADNYRGDLEKIKPFAKLFNKKYHDGPASFNEEGDFMAYSRNNYGGKSVDEQAKFQIFTSTLDENEEWTEAKSIHFNNSEYSVMHPALSPDGKTLYFSSDMPGGFGKFDLYVSYMELDSTWTEPINLGEKINTEGNEMFPFMHKNGMFFFASNGLLGLGGLDIFYTKIENGQFLRPKNPGISLNSSKNDFAFVIDDKMRRGFFSSNRLDGEGSDDIYSFRLKKAFQFDVYIRGKVVDTTGHPLPNTMISLYDDAGNILEMDYTDQYGSFEYTVAPDQNYEISAEKPKYLPDSEKFELQEGVRIYEETFVLEELPKFTFFCEVIDKKSNDPLQDVTVFINDNRKEEKTKLQTANKGEVIYRLPDYDLNDSLDLYVTIFKDGYAPASFELKQFLNSYGDIKKKVKLQKIEIGEDLGKLLGINPIYFDYDKSDIRPDAAHELDKIIEIMNQYPNMVIELSSHTDCRGSSIYNLKLSDRRAKASANYIKTKIKNPTRIYGDGYGESQLINDCACEGSRRSSCSEEEHQENRRTEFKIVRI